MRNFMRPTALGFVLALTACSGSGDSAGGSEAERLFAAYLLAEGQDLESCFDNLPAVETDVAGETFAGAEMPVAAEAANRLVIALDASGSMAGRVGGGTKMEAAKSAASSFLAAAPENVEVGLVAFGHRGNNREDGKALSCSAVDTVYPLGSADRDRIRSALAGFGATGWTPLAAAIAEAGRSFTPTETPGAQIVYIVSDGEETCGGDPVAAARLLHEGDVQAVINIIGFDLAESDRAQLRAVAAAGGGSFVEAEGPSELSRLAAEARRSLRNNMARARTNMHDYTRMARNNRRAYSAVGRLNACVNGRIVRENRRSARWLAANVEDLDTRKAVRALVQARNDAFRQRRQAYADAAEARRAGANEILRNDVERAKEEWEEAR
jgi:Ca-activated chloride channel family protein